MSMHISLPPLLPPSLPPSFPPSLPPYPSLTAALERVTASATAHAPVPGMRRLGSTRPSEDKGKRGRDRGREGGEERVKSVRFLKTVGEKR